MKNQKIIINHTLIPNFFYGTAWKEEKTQALTFAALQAGFTAIDTANQRKHYYEAAVGLGIQQFLAKQFLKETDNLLPAKKREDLFLQTKFTFARGQDQRKPYLDTDSFTKQVASSFASSLVHLKTDYIDSYVLHGPYGSGIGAADLECWKAMEELLENKKIRFLGISNVSAAQLESLYQKVNLKPSFVQNRCYASDGWDQEVRNICRAKNIIYQGFSLLTANRVELKNPAVLALAAKYNKTIPQIIFRFCQQLGMICLTGTTNAEHMKTDLAIDDFALSAAEVSQLELLSES